LHLKDFNLIKKKIVHDPRFCCIYTVLTLKDHCGEGCRIVSKPRNNTAHLLQRFQCFTKHQSALRVIQHNMCRDVE